jgi:hypothetical protein
MDSAAEEKGFELSVPLSSEWFARWKNISRKERLGAFV